MEKNNLSVVFISNFYNHHQKYLSDALHRLSDGNYYFIETEAISKERLNMGWGGEKKPDYVKTLYSSAADAVYCQSIIDSADVVIIGSAPNELIKDRIKKGKLVFRYSERPLKKGFEPLKYLPRFFTWRLRNPSGKPIYMLCASAYTAGDYARFGMYRNKCFKWGYFPEVKRYDDINKIIEWKHPASILWVARFIEWKHPEVPIMLAELLKKDGYRFQLNLIGNGELEEEIQKMIETKKLSDCVHMLGSMSPEKVRKHMEDSEIFLFTSDRNEGWGAVLNESMNSACAVVANHAIGSVSFLLKDGENGLIYKDGNIDSMYKKVKFLLDNRERCHEYGIKAYETMTTMWNADVAAERFIELSKAILNGNKQFDLFDSGICSKADILKDGWYR